jgi:hypothetical protein
MELWYSLVIGSVAFGYIQLYNRNAKRYFDNNSLSINSIFDW